MNIGTKILLSLVIVSLSALVVPLEGHSENSKTESVAVQTAVRIAENVDKNSIEEQLMPINFEISNVIEEMNHKMAEIEVITDKREWFLAYKKIIEKYSYIIDSPETIYDYFSKEELDLLFHVVQAEVGDEYSFESKINVANVIFNRFYHERFPDTLSEVLVSNQFSTIANGRYKKVEVSEDTILACEYSYMFSNYNIGNAVYFQSIGYQNYFCNAEYVYYDGCHYFYEIK